MLSVRLMQVHALVFDQSDQSDQPASNRRASRKRFA
jgi:hypothetical protein